jgi:hypothetical protein
MVLLVLVVVVQAGGGGHARGVSMSLEHAYESRGRDAAGLERLASALCVLARGVSMVGRRLLRTAAAAGRGGRRGARAVVAAAAGA